MAEKRNRTKTKEEIEAFFLNLKDKTPEQISKIKKLAMGYNIKLGAKRKLFCNNCYSVFDSKNTKVRIKNERKVVRCLHCGQIARWKIK